MHETRSTTRAVSKSPGARKSLALGAAFALGAALLFCVCGGGGSGDGPTGGVTPKESFSKVMGALMTKWNVPGGAAALVRNEKLIMAEGYGKADKESGAAAAPETLFRIASLSKPLTSAAILKLVESGLLSLDDKPFLILNDIDPIPGGTVDPRLTGITIRDLLQHSGGWDSAASFDAMFRSREIAAAWGIATPPDARRIIGYMMKQPLDFTPGTKYAYSNFGYCVLGRVIEKVTGESYETYMMNVVLPAMGISRMRPGRSLQAGRAAGEAVYYDYAGAPLATSVFSEAGEPVPWPYGGFALEPMDSHGGWLASAVDLMRFVTAVDGRTARPDFLQAATIDLMVARPDLPDWQTSDWYYALGWQVRPTGSGANWWHMGSLPGTSTIMVRAANGLAWAALFSTRPANADAFLSELDSEIWRAVNSVTEWPTTDLFPSFGVAR